MIDNKTIFFHKELRDHITSETELCIQCQSITFLALAKFLTGLNGSRKINVLIGAENKTLENFTSAEIDVKVQNELETLQQAINLMESSSNTLSIRSGYCGLNIVILKNPGQTWSYLYTQDPLDTDKVQKDLATQCADIFNLPIRPKIFVESFEGKNVIIIDVEELPGRMKPIYFKKMGLPKGAYRRIGSTDHHCTEDDLFFFYNKEDSFDSTVVEDSDLDDISYEAVALYRRLREKVNASAEELQYSDVNLLRSLNCIKKIEEEWKLTNCGLIVFGNKMALRRLVPMIRVDYIRLAGKEWVENPEERFISTLDLRGPLIELVHRTISAIADDLPTGFLLPEGQIQAQSKWQLPFRVLREAIVNAFIHRSYRVNQPIQILRYSNRIEIINAGFSLKPEETIGEPGSVNRNSFIASIFHETNLAETKGTGFKTMQHLMKSSDMLPPTFESNHSKNNFTLRLLLHHFLNEFDVKWLDSFRQYNLSEDQKLALIFVREVGAIDNDALRQLTGAKRLKAGKYLRELRLNELLTQKGTSKSPIISQVNR